MREFLAHPGAGTVIGTEDPRHLARLRGLTTNGHLGTDLLYLDNADAFIATVGEVLGPGQGNALLEAVIRTTSAVGTPLLLIALLVASTARWVESMGLRLILGAITGMQAALAGLLRGAVTDGAPGRGVILDGATTTAYQIVLRTDFPVSASERDGAYALRLESLSTRLTWEDVPGGTWAMGGDTAAPVTLPAHTSVLVAEPPGSGRFAALWASAQAMVSDPPAVDDLGLADIATVTQVEVVLARFEVVLASASTEKVTATFRGAISTMHEREAFVVLWPGMHPTDRAAGISPRSATDPGAMTLPDRGALVYHRTCLPIQIMQPQPGDSDRPIRYPV